MNGPLSYKQVRVLICIAREAFAVAKPAQDFTTWRRDQVSEATGGKATGLSTAYNLQYNAIKAHFLALKGATGRAFDASLREQTEDIRQVRHNLGTLLCEHNLSPAYANAISLDRYGIADVMQCNVEQTLQILMTVKSRFTKKDAEEGKRSHRKGFAPKRRDKKKPVDPLDPTHRLPALDASTPSIASTPSTQRNPLTESHA